MRYQRVESPALLNGHQAAREFFASCFAGQAETRERLLVAHIDSRAQCIHLSQHDGDPSSVALPVRSIIADAARLGSSGVVLAHNHPSGDAMPSKANCRATRALAQAGEPRNLIILDHLIFAPGDRCHSMRRKGLL